MYDQIMKTNDLVSCGRRWPHELRSTLKLHRMKEDLFRTTIVIVFSSSLEAKSPLVYELTERCLVAQTREKTKQKKNKLTAKNIAREEQKHGCLHESKIISCRQVRAPSLSLSLQVWRARSLHLPRNVAAERKVKTNTPDVPVLDEGSRRYPTKRCIVVGPTGFATSFGNPRSNLDRFLREKVVLVRFFACQIFQISKDDIFTIFH